MGISQSINNTKENCMIYGCCSILKKNTVWNIENETKLFTTEDIDCILCKIKIDRNKIQEDKDYTIYYSKKEQEDNKKYKINRLFNSEYFINDGKSLFYIAQLIETDIISKEILDYIEFKNGEKYLEFYYKENYNKILDIQIIKKWKIIFIKLLFEEHANIYSINSIDCIIKWLPKYILLFGTKSKVIEDVLNKIEWDNKWN